MLGEDPGLLDQASGAAGLTLTLLWFLTAVGWAAWRGWSRPPAEEPISKNQTPKSGWFLVLGNWFSRWGVEGGLLAVVGAVIASALGAASYKYPAWLIASEWLTFLIAFILVRQLARTEGDSRRVLAVLLASAVSLSAYGLYQRTVDLPGQQKSFENPQVLVQALAREGIYVDVNDPMLEHWKN